MKNDIEKVLNYDSFEEAQKITNKNYKEDKTTSALAFGKFIENNQKKDQLLESLNDSIYNMNSILYKKLIESMNFVEVLNIPFHGDYWNYDDNFYIHFHKETGSILRWDTFQGKYCNSANLYFNWLSNSKDRFGNNLHLSGGCEVYKDDYCFVGSIDAREAFRYYFTRLQNEGKFITPWIHQGFLWLLNYEDSKNKNYDYKKINEERIKMLPKYVQEAIQGNDLE